MPIADLRPALFMMPISVVGAVVAVAPWSDRDVVGVMLFAAVVGWLSLRHCWLDGQRRPAWLACIPIVVLAFVLRTGVGTVQHWYDFLPLLYRWDVDTYNARAWLLVQDWSDARNQAGPATGLNVAVHEHVTAALFWLFGRSILATTVVNALLGALSLYYVFLTASVVVGRRSALWIVGLLAVWPSHVLWTSQNFREPWVFYFMARALHSTVRWLVWRAGADWLKAAGFALAVALFRMPTGAVVAAGLVAVSAYDLSRRVHWTLRVPAVLATTAGLATVGLGLAGGWLTLLRPALSPEALTYARRVLATGGSAFYPDLVYRDWFDVLAFLPVGLLYMLLAPFPWQVTNLAQLASAAENAALVFLLGLTIVRARPIAWLHGWSLTLIAAVTLAGLAAFSLVDSNVGTAYRHKMQFVPYLLIVLAVAWPATEGRRAVRQRGLEV